MLDRPINPRLHIRSIKDTEPVRLDDEIGELFREMRLATSLSQQQIADQFGTSLQAIDFLERGNLSALPSWNETKRVIVEYTNMLGLDPEPVLRRVMLQLPGDHPRRPRTQEFEPSYDNMRANAKAIMNRVPESQIAVESESLTRQLERSVSTLRDRSAASFENNQPFVAPIKPTSSYGDMRAIPPNFAPPDRKSPARMVAKKRKTSVFVPFVQLLLLLIIVTTGYMMWLGVNDPQGFEDLKTLVSSGWQWLEEQVEVWMKP